MTEKKDCNKHRWIPLVGMDKKKNVPTFLFTCLKCGDLKVGFRTIKISRFRLDMGGLPMNSVAGIKLIAKPTTESTASGLIISAIVNSNSRGVGAPLFMGTNGGFNVADATSSMSAPCVALAVEAGVGSKKVLLQGILRSDVWNWIVGPGSTSLVYLSNTTGLLTQTPPASKDSIVQPVGWALSANTIYFTPSMIYLTRG